MSNLLQLLVYNILYLFGIRVSIVINFLLVRNLRSSLN